MAKLTKKGVDALKEPGRYGDGDGLHLLISKTGSKSWMVRTVVQGKRTDIGLGGVKTVSLAEARVTAAETRRLARQGLDPRAARKRATETPTFEEAARTVHETIKPNWREGGVHVRHWIASLEHDVFPKIGSKSISDITSADVLSVLTP
ncbi:MAG: Arm DNA-binding domain-containing protein, partial [Pseudomonadota bacterium]